MRSGVKQIYLIILKSSLKIKRIDGQVYYMGLNLKYFYFRDWLLLEKYTI